MSVQRNAPIVDMASLPAISDDECVTRLAEAVEAHEVEAKGLAADGAKANDSDHLDEVAGLIGRLAVPIEI